MTNSGSGNRKRIFLCRGGIASYKPFDRPGSTGEKLFDFQAPNLVSESHLMDDLQEFVFIISLEEYVA
jgi:hypothetical protein